MPYRITQCYLPPDRGDIPPLPQAKLVLDLATPAGCRAELTKLAGYILRWYTRLKTVTHPSTNRARRALTSFMRRTPLTTTPRRQPRPFCAWVQHASHSATEPPWQQNIYYYFASHRAALYCYERVCLSVSLSVCLHILERTHARTDEQPENIMPPALSVGWAEYNKATGDNNRFYARSRSAT